MSFLTGSMILDCPASALNNSQADATAATDNTVPVKKIRVGRDAYAYVSAQAVRYWLRTTLETNGSEWKSAPVHRENKVAYTDAEPISFWDDDLFGYMRAPSKKESKKEVKGAPAAPLEKDRDITRVSPLRVSTFVSVAPAAIVSDFGTMTRHEGDPVPFEHEFYRAHLGGMLSLDLSAAGTFFDGERVGFRNLDSHRRERATALGLESVQVKNQPAFRLALDKRQERVSTLIRAFKFWTGGAKQALHYTDITPAIAVLAVTQHGNNPFSRLFVATKERGTAFHAEAFAEILSVYAEDFLSPIYIGWQKGFLDDERVRLEAAIAEYKGPVKIILGHPVDQFESVAAELSQSANAAWYA